MTIKQEIIKRLLEEKAITFEEMLTLLDLSTYSYPILTPYQPTIQPYTYTTSCNCTSCTCNQQ